MFDLNTYLLPEEHFKFLLNKECDRAERYTHFFSMLMVKLDLDDPLLSTTANLIQDVIRNSDIIGALQDKNLGVILHHVDAQNCDDIAVRVRERIQDYTLGLLQDLQRQNIRVGIACFPTHAPTAQDLLRAAQERFLN